MKHSEQDQLLREILEPPDFRCASLEEGLKAIRQQRRRQRAVRVCALVALPFLLALGILVRRAHETSVSRIASRPPATVASTASPTGSGDIKFITDEELFALFPDRSLALIGKPGQQQLVFLDQPATSYPR